jgi:hypothetical protein
MYFYDYACMKSSERERERERERENKKREREKIQAENALICITFFE